MVDFELKNNYDISDLLRLLQVLRAPGGCPWDREQTHESLRRNLLEEAYETVEALDAGEPEHLKEELGDVLMQVVFHSAIEADAGHFNFTDVCDSLCKRLIERHPHLFGMAEQRQDWDEIKRKLRGEQTVTQSLESVCKALPGLWQAEKLLKKAEKSPLYRCDADEAAHTVQQTAEALRQNTAGEAELGSALFALAQLARLRSLDTEDALQESCKQFISDFSRLEAGENA